MDLDQRLVAALAVDEVEELPGGYQSRVFRSTDREGVPVVVKVFDASMVDRVELDTRLDVTAALADLDASVCRPLLPAGRRVTEVVAAEGCQHYAVCFEFATGTEPDPGDADDAAGMGRALAQLHASMRRLPATSLPIVRALRSSAPADASIDGPHQLLHGDFNTSNLRRSGRVLRIFDLDDCGYGPPAFDVANALYMVLFDVTIRGSVETYERFRRSFVGAYVSASGSSLPDATLDRFIDLRVRALGRGTVLPADRRPSRRGPTMTSTESGTSRASQLMREAFDAIAAKDLDRLATVWDDQTVDDFVALGRTVRGETALRAFFGELFAAVPNLQMTVEAIHDVDERTAVGQWRMQGDFTGGPFNGIEPTGRHIDLRGIDVMRFENGRLRHNDVYYDGLGFARQIGLLPGADSRADRAMLTGFNALTRAREALRERRQARG